MGTVYEATHLFTRKRVALKTMLPGMEEDPALSSDFDREMSVTAAIDCPHLVQVLDAGIDEEIATRFIVMELLDGENLADVVRRRGRLESAEVVLLMSQVATALDATHAHGIVHRDLKPENLFLTQSRGAPHIKLLDFGIAKNLTTAATLTRCLGTPLYMSPEQLMLGAPVTPAVDIYAFGQIAFTLLVGIEYWKPPPQAEYSHPISLALSISRGVTVSPNDIAEAHGVHLPEAFAAWFMRTCAKEPADRWATATQCADALARALEAGTWSASGTYETAEAPTRPASGTVPAFIRTASQATDETARTIAVSPPLGTPYRETISKIGVRPAASAPLHTPFPTQRTDEDRAVFDRLVEVIASFTSKASAERDVRVAVMRVCGSAPDATRLEYVVEELMAAFPRQCVTTRAEMCIALIDFCERERRSRSDRRQPTRSNRPAGER